VVSSVGWDALALAVNWFATGTLEGTWFAGAQAARCIVGAVVWPCAVSARVVVQWYWCSKLSRMLVSRSPCATLPWRRLRQLGMK
jgi:hypothetical protein